MTIIIKKIHYMKKTLYEETLRNIIWKVSPVKTFYIPKRFIYLNCICDV